jgi:hypothetical protein
LFFSSSDPFDIDRGRNIYKIDDGQWLPMLGDNSVLISHLSKDFHDLTIKVIRDALQDQELHFSIESDISFFESKTFYNLLLFAFVFSLFLFFFYYFINQRKKLLVSEKNQNILASFEVSNIPTAIYDVQGNIKNYNNSFLSFFDVKEDGHPIIDAKAYNKIEKSLALTIMNGEHNTPISFEIQGHTIHVLANFKLLKKRKGLILMSLMAMKSSHQSELVRNITSHGQMKSFIEYFQRNKSNSAVFMFVRCEDLMLDVCLDKLNGLATFGYIDLVFMGLMYGTDIGVLLKANNREDIFFQLVNLEHEISNFNGYLQIGIVADISKYSNQLAVLEAANIALDFAAKRSELVSFDEDFVNQSYIYYKERITSRLSVTMLSDMYVSPIVSVKSGVAQAITCSFYPEFESKYDHLFIPVEEQFQLYELMFSKIDEVNKCLCPDFPDIYIPIPLAYLKIFTEPFLQSFVEYKEAYKGEIILLIEAQYKKDLYEYQSILELINSVNLDYAIAVSHISHYSFKDLFVNGVKAIFVDLSVENESIIFESALDALITMAMSLNVKIVLCGVENERGLLYQNKGVDYLTGGLIMEPKTIQEANKVLLKNYLPDIKINNILKKRGENIF